MIENLFFCENCREEIVNVSEILFVEENSDRGFCGEDCIMRFYRPYMAKMEKEELIFRDSLSLSEESSYSEIIASEKFLEKTLQEPDEKWRVVNDLDQQYYTHIFKLSYNSQEIYFILICSYIEGGPSFVYYRTATKSKELVNRYRRGVEVSTAGSVSLGEINTSSKEVEQQELNTEIIEALEGKKSSVLAEMMENRSSADISIEDFIKYDRYLDLTVENPDEIYEKEDMEGDLVHTFIKSFQEAGVSFFYIVIALPHKLEDAKETVVLPILGFPSIDEDLYPKYATGRKLNETLKN